MVLVRRERMTLRSGRRDGELGRNDGAGRAGSSSRPARRRAGHDGAGVSGGRHAIDNVEWLIVSVLAVREVGESATGTEERCSDRCFLNLSVRKELVEG
jgi:hypothetical protein